MTHLQKTDTGFLVWVFGTGFWCMCHWHNGWQYCSYDVRCVRTRNIIIGTGPHRARVDAVIVGVAPPTDM